MHNLWDDATAQRCASTLELRAYSSRLIGSESGMVLYGGGNTSLKTADTLYVKGTGADLAAVREEHFTALDLGKLRMLLDDKKLPDDELMCRVDGCKRDPQAPKPSIETLLHAALPYPHVEHAHADAVLAVANVDTCEATCAEVFGDLAPVVPYRHSGAGLARACQAVFESRATAGTIGLILAFHGVVAFGHSTRESYENLLRLVNLAEDWLQRCGAWQLPVASARRSRSDPGQLQLAASAIAGFPLAMHVVSTPETLAYAQHADIAEISQQGPPTPQHAIYTKRVPLLDAGIDAYAQRYRGYLEQTLGPAAHGIDAAPRIALDPAFGLCAFGVNDRYAEIAAEIYLHDIAIITRASAHGRYRAASARDIARAEHEYGGFERRVRARAAA